MITKTDDKVTLITMTGPDVLACLCNSLVDVKNNLGSLAQMNSRRSISILLQNYSLSEVCTKRCRQSAKYSVCSAREASLAK